MGDFPEYFHTYVGGGGNHDSPFCVFDAQQKEMLGEIAMRFHENLSSFWEILKEMILS